MHRGPAARETGDSDALTAFVLDGSFVVMVRSGLFGRPAMRVLARRLTLPILGLSALLAAGACSDKALLTPAQKSSPTTELPAAARYLIGLSSTGAPPAALTKAIQAAGGRIVHSHAGTGIMLVTGLSQAAANAIYARHEVQMMMPDFTFKLRAGGLRMASASQLRALGYKARPRAGDPRNALAFSEQWNMQVIHADSAWQITTQGLGSHVYILDTGVDTTHQELRGRLDIAHDTSFAYDVNNVNDTGPPYNVYKDSLFHGTFVTSQVTTNAIVIAGVSPQATVAMVRVFDLAGSASYDAVLNGILYATDENADVVNMSLGGYFSRTAGGDNVAAQFFQRVVGYAIARGTLVVAAAGNEGVDWNTAQSALTGYSYVDSLEFPAGIKHVMSIGATGPYNQQNFDQIAYYSNYGAPGVGVFAPGGNNANNDTTSADFVIGACSSFFTQTVDGQTLSCLGADTLYLLGDGTSFASPLVAGEAAVVKANAGGTISESVLENCILTTADEPNGDSPPDVNYNYGRINVLSAVLSGNCK
jgi:lantibiotic leader peptide-processing serine protease